MAHTTIRRPSATSPISLAAFTREQALKVSSLLSNSSMAGIHASPTSDSRIRAVRLGEMVMSDIRLDKGFSIRLVPCQHPDLA